jgi:hypothetical protein
VKYNKISISKFAFLILGCAIVAASCEDEGSTIGGNILPKEEIVGVYNYDAMPVHTNNILMDSIQSDDVDYALLGHLNDPEFGNSRADFFGQLTLGSKVPNGVFNPYDGYIVDSAKIFLSFQKLWLVGDTVANHKVSIYRLTQSPDRLKNYYSNHDMNGWYDPSEPIAERVMNAKDILLGEKEKRDSVWNISKRDHQWAFKLNDQTANYLFNLDKASLESREAFTNAFKGIYITSELQDHSSAGTMMKFDILNQKSYMTLYYSYIRKDKYNTVIDTLHYNFSFYFNREGLRANRFENENSVIDLNPNPQFLYVQSLAGSAAQFKFPADIYNWQDSVREDSEHKIGISTVDFVFHIDTAQSKPKKYNLPTQLQIKQRNPKSGKLETPTFLTSSGTYEQAFIGGAVNLSTLTYHFRFARGFFESVLKNDDKIFEREFYLVPSTSKSDYTRVVLKSSEAINNEQRLKLDIKYVKFH